MIKTAICLTCLRVFPYKKRNNEKKRKRGLYCSRVCYYLRPNRHTKDRPGESFNRGRGRWTVFWNENGKRIIKDRAIWVWEQHYGIIPRGYEVHHKNGDRKDNNIENLELLEENEHEDLHKFLDFSKEVDKLSQEELDAPTQETAQDRP
jgi:hypothetical protein